MNPALSEKPGQLWAVLNVTPDSFSDGGNFLAPSVAIQHALRMSELGADVIDVGGESTRPGAKRISLEDELQRVLPVVEALVAQGIAISIDTMRAEVARRAVQAGAVVVNDVSGGRSDAEMFKTVAELGVDYVLMHWRGYGDQMDSLAVYQDVVQEVLSELETQLVLAETYGLSRNRIILDPGLGFAKQPEHNWQLLRAIPKLQSQHNRWLIGASRKRFLAPFSAADAPAGQRDAATSLVSFYAGLNDCYAVRVHEVPNNKHALEMAQKLRDSHA